MNPYLLPVLEMGPSILSRLVDQIEAPRLDEPAGPDRFSPREVIAHLADWEPILLGRIRQTVERPGSMIEPQDEDAMAIAHAYASSDVIEQLKLFAAARKQTAEYLRALPKEAWQKSVVHPERGEMSVSDQANMLLGHDLYHIEQLSGAIGPKTAGTW